MSAGDHDKHSQELLEKTGLRSRSHRYTCIWRMRCTNCDSIYGCNSCDAHSRRCPLCQGGRPPEPLPEDYPQIVPGPGALSTTRTRRKAPVRPSNDTPGPPVVRKGVSQTTCFDAYIMVDCNSTNGALRASPIADAPWIAEAWWNGAARLVPAEGVLSDSKAFYRSLIGTIARPRL